MEFRTEVAILEEMVRDGKNIGLINTSEDVLTKLKQGLNTENQYILDLNTHALQLEVIESKGYDIYLNTNIDTAYGEGLDSLGNLLNVRRIQPQSSLVEVQITLPTASTTDIIIPKNTKCNIVEIRENGSDYVTQDEVIINAGVTSATVICESIIQDYLPPLVEGAITGLVGFNDFIVTQNTQSKGGRRIEEDEEYRTRIKQWAEINKIGTRGCIEDYLNNFPGLDAYFLIPLYEGVGTLKVVCDTIEGNLPLIAEGLYDQCMDCTDIKPVCVLPDSKLIQELTLTVNKAENMSISNDELKELLIAQTKTFIEGGVTRNGFRTLGLGIGKSLFPTQLIRSLANDFPEVENIKLSINDEVPVQPTEKIKLGAIEVVFE